VTDEPPQPNVLFQSYINGQLMRALMERAFEAHGAAFEDFGLYSAIGIWGPITPTELARRVGMRPTTLSSALKRLERRGHVRRQRHPSDGRSHLVELTEAGDRRWKDGRPPLLESVAQVAQQLGEEHEDVAERLRRFEHALRSALDAPTISQ
jgi:DNA-binding MarR family transcriptional regulator